MKYPLRTSPIGTSCSRVPIATRKMVPSRVVSIAFFGLVQENVSLLSIEIVCYLTTFLLMLHIHSSGKRNATMLAAAFVQLVIMELLFFGQKRWHAQSLIMLIPERLPLFTVLIQAHFYYMAFVATSRLRIDSFIQPLAMGCLVLLFIFPFEILGAKFLWWTWHDTDPILVDRALGVPYHIFFNHFFFAVAFLTGHHLVRWTVLEGEYYEDDNWKREWSYVMFVPFITNLFGVVLLILFYHLFVELLHVQTAASFGLLLLMSLTFCWMADRERDDPYLQNILAPVDAYDSDWLYPFIDHAVNQMVFVYSLIEIVLIGLIDPSTIVSVGHHQPLGDCDENETFRTILGMRHNRKRYLCVHEYDEEFNLCNYPVAQLNYEESWYMICGRGYADYATYLAVILGFIFFTNLLFYQILKRPHRTRIVSFQRKHL